MKANELSIGDWVCYNTLDDYIGKVRAIFLDEIRKSCYVKLEKHVQGFDNMNHNTCYNVELLSPITLTKEILEKNGWVYNNEDEKFFPQTWVGGGLMLQDADDCGYRIVVTSDYDDEDTNDTPFIILYVHELQHALMLRRIKKEIIS